MAVHAQRPDRPIATLGRCGRRIAPPVPMGCAHIRLHAGLRIWAKATSSAESARTGWFVAGAGRVGMRFCRARTAAGMPDVLPTRVLLSVPAHLTIRPALRGLLTPLLEGTQRPVGHLPRHTQDLGPRVDAFFHRVLDLGLLASLLKCLPARGRRPRALFSGVLFVLPLGHDTAPYQRVGEGSARKM